MQDLRQNYTKHNLLERDLPESPFELFESWFQDAVEAPVLEPNAMILSTSANDRVDSRTVLLKGVRNNQFVFFTNYQSNKASQLIENENCTLLFLWLRLERQVIIRGKAKKVSNEESENYFNSRPRESQIGAWVSEQSSRINSREDLETKLEDYKCEFEGKPILKPKNWGGFEVTPLEIEFWQGRESRLHDRILYSKLGSSWSYSRLQP